jgi:hypothetical protein
VKEYRVLGLARVNVCFSKYLQHLPPVIFCVLRSVHTPISATSLFVVVHVFVLELKNNYIISVLLVYYCVVHSG